ncbi:MAG: PQQ-binding-like beta-propeller repeat protein [Desulfosalsimonadaceae bacterium]
MNKPLLHSLCLLACLLFILPAPGRAGTTTVETSDILSITISRNYVMAGQDSVRFDCVATLDQSGGPPAVVTLKIDYEDDQIMDDSVTFTSPEGPEVVHAFDHVFSKPGYWTAVLYAEIDGIRHDLDAATVNAAKWKFTGNGTLGGVSGGLGVGGDGTIYAGSEDGSLYAVNPDGSLKWMFATNGPIESAVAIGPDETLYFGSSDGSLYTVTPDGALKWTFTTGGPVFASPALSRDGETVYAASTDGRLYAVSARTGAAAWPSGFSARSKLISSPVVGYDGTIYIGGLDHFLYAVTPAGALIWEIDLKSEIHGSPALDGDGIIYVGTSRFGGAKDGSNRLVAVYPHGAEKWGVSVDSGFASAPVVDSSGTILAASYDNKVYAFDRNGGQLWIFNKFTDESLGSPAIAATDLDDLTNLVYTASRDGMIYALNLDETDYLTGREIVWQYDLGMPVTACSPTVDNGSVYIGTAKDNRGELWAFAAEPVEFDETPQAAAKTDAPWPLARGNLRNTGTTPVTPDTLAPMVTSTDPANGAVDFDTARTSITATFSVPMDPDLIYVPATETSDGFIGFTVTPLYHPKTDSETETATLVEAEPEDFEIRWISDRQVELVLPAGVAFQKDTLYTATIQTKTAESTGDERKRLLSAHTWTFSGGTKETVHYSGDRGCFIRSASEE